MRVKRFLKIKRSAQVTIEYIVIFMIVLVVILASIKAFIEDRNNEHGLYKSCEDMLSTAVEKIRDFPHH